MYKAIQTNHFFWEKVSHQNNWLCPSCRQQLKSRFCNVLIYIIEENGSAYFPKHPFYLFSHQKVDKTLFSFAYAAQDEASITNSTLDVALGPFVTSWLSHWCAFRVSFCRLTTVGMVHHIFSICGYLLWLWFTGSCHFWRFM